MPSIIPRAIQSREMKANSSLVPVMDSQNESDGGDKF